MRWRCPFLSERARGDFSIVRVRGVFFKPALWYFFFWTKYFPPCWWWRVQCYAFLKRPQNRHLWAYLWALASSEARARPDRRFKLPDVPWTGCTDSFFRHTRLFCDAWLALLDFAFLPPLLVCQSSGRCFFVTALYVICAQCLIFSSMYFLYIHFFSLLS